MPIQKTHSQVQSVRTRKKGKSRAAIEIGSHELRMEDSFDFPQWHLKLRQKLSVRVSELELEHALRLDFHYLLKLRNSLTCSCSWRT